MHTRIPSTGHDLSPREGWGDVPVADRPTWTRYMLDYPPLFPGAFIMAMLAPGMLDGGTSALQPWKDLAQRLHAVGFTPTDYYLLCQDLALRIEEGAVTREEHDRFFDRWGDRVWGHVPKVALWAAWPRLVRSGRSPRRATDYILSDGSPAPLGGYGPTPDTLTQVGD